VAVIGSVTLLKEAVGTKSGDINFEGGTLNYTDDKFVWIFRVSSSTVEALRLHLENVNLPSSTELVVYSSTFDTITDGPYRGPYANHQFWTRSLSGDYLTIAIRSTTQLENVTDTLSKISFQIKEVAQVSSYVPSLSPSSSSFSTRTLSSSKDTWPCQNDGDCFLDPQCAHSTSSDAISWTKKAVAKLEWVDTAARSLVSCSGTLLADSDNSSERPLLMTAKHCFSDSVDFTTVEAYFFYTTDKCNGTCPGNLVNGQPRPIADTMGATLLSYDTTLDYALLELTENNNSHIPNGVVFLGWDSSKLKLDPKQTLHRISTPNFGAQVYSEHKVNLSPKTLCGLKPQNMITTNVIQGDTSFGSSGSPIVDNQGNFLGHLRGKCGTQFAALCSSRTTYVTVDSAFSVYFSRIQKFLMVDDKKNMYTPNVSASCKLVKNGLPCKQSTDCCSKKCQCRKSCSKKCQSRMKVCVP